ncbi:MAG: VWA domain-containing protein [Pseudomonadota bacterium]
MLPEFAQLEHFHFLRPAWVLLLIPWCLIALAQRRRGHRRDMFGDIIAPHLLDHLKLKKFQSRWFNPATLSTLVFALCLVLLMGPSWKQQPSPLSQDDSALVILLDVSNSMEQDDVQPSRLQRAKQKVSDLLALRPDKKAALIVYAGSAHTVLSLTADQEILNQYLAAIKPGIMPLSGKFPEYALPNIDRVLRESSAPATVVMLADGVGAETEAAFDRYFSAHPHQLLVLGIGSEQPLEGVAPMERNALRSLARNSDGYYVDLTVDDGDVRKVDRRVNSHFVILEDSALPWLDSGYVLVFPLMALFLMWFRTGWTITWGWLALPLVLHWSSTPVVAQLVRTEAEPMPASASELPRSAPRPIINWFVNLWLTGDQQGRLLMQWGDYLQAASRFTDTQWKAMAYYYNEDFMLAAEYFSRSTSDVALFNEANARAQARDYVRAVNRYDRLLARTPSFPGAAQNRDTVQSIIDEINRLSESQQQESGVSGENKELDGDDAIPAQGADELTWEKAELKQLTAEDILADPATSEMWLRAVQQDPSNFLAIKFSMQSQRDADGGPEQ